MGAAKDRLDQRQDANVRIQKSEPASEKMAALKARVAAAIGSSKAKGGLGVPLHPDLQSLGTPSSASGRSSGSIDAKASQLSLPADRSLAGEDSRRKTPQHNPYYDESLADQTISRRARHSKQLIFNQRGKYIQQANALRRQAALEAMKKRIADQTKKAGIDEDTDIERGFAVEEPPSIEWWDEGLIDGRTYDGIFDPKQLLIQCSNSIVTEYVQHPVALEPPQERNIAVANAMFLTSKEQAKLRRQRRMAELKELQAKVRLGLVPAPPPKVKKGNLMRVLGDVAVKDPTAVEAQVNRQIAERHSKHVEANESRKLTKEQRQEKAAANQQKDAEKGVHIMVFRIKSLANGQHRFKVAKNAEQWGLTGTCIMHPKLCLVVAEGGQWSINKYKKLLLNRIDWTENAPTRERDAEHGKAMSEWLLAENERGDLKDMSLNQCDLIFEGEEKIRVFRKWSSKVCETDAEAREILGRAKMDNLWSLAKEM